jgi:uncharacterized membrane protein YqhA
METVFPIYILHLGHFPGLSEVQPSIVQTYFVATSRLVWLPLIARLCLSSVVFAIVILHLVHPLLLN